MDVINCFCIILLYRLYLSIRESSKFPGTVYRWRKRRPWNNWEEHWFPMQDQCLILIILSALKGMNNPTPTDYQKTKKKTTNFSYSSYSLLDRLIDVGMILCNRSSKETTTAKSPNLRVLQRKERRKLGSAYHMRWVLAHALFSGD